MTDGTLLKLMGNKLARHDELLVEMVTSQQEIHGGGLLPMSAHEIRPSRLQNVPIPPQNGSCPVLKVMNPRYEFIDLSSKSCRVNGFGKLRFVSRDEE
ncbi:hypothetical protein HAX54_021622 [Datura stramonium]|uniref:Uncharacterized protein n=1 Tax=Datura stramonium TaxID=4076 RepID=A0ABS8UT92_DATST|nr:hypothetical protein [Datura stramonium]